MEIRSVLIAGGGQMGSGIAQVAAQAGCEVLLYDVDEERIQEGDPVDWQSFGWKCNERPHVGGTASGGAVSNQRQRQA